MYKCKRYQNQQDLSEEIYLRKIISRFGNQKTHRRRIFFLFCTRFSFPFSAIEKLFWNLRGVQRSCRPLPLYPPLKTSVKWRLIWKLSTTLDERYVAVWVVTLSFWWILDVSCLPIVFSFTQRNQITFFFFQQPVN